MTRSRPMARRWTWWLQRLAVRVHIRTYICLYTYIMLYYTYTVFYVCINVKSAFSGPQNQHFNYIMRSTTLHKICCIYIHFWNWVVSNHGGSTEATRGCGRVSSILAGWWACFLWYFADSYECIQICSRCTVPTCTTLATGPTERKISLEGLLFNRMEAFCF